MPVLTRQDLWNQLQRHVIAPVYVLFGAETFLRDLAAATIAKYAFAAGDVRDFNDTTFSLNTEDNLERALAVAQQLPMMASRRVVSVTDVRVSATGFRDTVTEHDEATLVSFLGDPPPTSVVIFVADELNGVRKLSKLLKENATAVEFVPLNDSGLLKSAREKFKETGVATNGAVLDQLIARVGTDVRRLTNEVNKLATAAMSGGALTAELVQALVPNTRELGSFVFIDHLLAGRKRAALAAVRKSLDDGAEPVMMLGSMAYSYRRLLVAKEMMTRGADRREIAGAVKLRYNDQQTFMATLNRVDARKLAYAIKSLARTDLAIKTSKGGGGPAAARTQIEMLVCELALI
jgi:DNA polymerase III subunit delta